MNIRSTDVRIDPAPSSTVEHHSVVIVGTGPTGMTAASLLGQYGVDCLVLDRWEDPFPQPRAVHLDDEIHRILGDLGLTQEFRAISRPGRGLRLISRDMSTLAEFGRDPREMPHGFPCANMFDQPHLEALLRERMNRCDTVIFRGSCEVVDVANIQNHVRVDYTDRERGATRSVTADYVLGCDGANSTVRAAMGSSMHELGFEQRWLVIDIATTADLHQWDGVHQLCDTARAGTYMRIGETRYRWEFRLLEHESASDYSTLEAIRPLIAPWIAAAPSADLELIRSTEYTFRAQVVDRWRERRILLLGDAAHLTPPFIGQGLGAGLRDAKNLVWKLVAVQRGVQPESALDTYEQERKPHVTGLISLAITVGWAMTGGGSAGDFARKRLVPRLVRVPLLNTRMTDSATPRLPESALIRRRRAARRDHAGSLCPNTFVQGGIRLDDVAPDRTLFVTITPPSPGQRREITRRGAVVVEVPRTSELGSWLAHGRAIAAIVRPDRTVMAASRSVSSLYTLVPNTVPPHLSARPVRKSNGD
nr:bifunctional 3-(3-hydroxy-phenyl)propionate/3-hydroxycinnamic acid hydroxylase [Rhodococcus sp. (in: high G+C Gram-positive bacteria)]